MNHSRRLRVVHLTLCLDVGGLEKLLVEFARHHDRARVIPHVVSLTTRGSLAADIEAAGVPVTALEAPEGLRPGLIARLAWLFAKLRADVVHTHDERPHIYGAPAARLAGVGQVIHTRHSQGTLLSRRQAWLVRIVSVCDSRFVCISHDSARHAIRQGIARRKVCVLHNGIDISRFAYSGPDPAGPAVLVARLAPEKDIGTLLQAVARIVPRQTDFRLLIAGDGPCRADLEAQAAQLGLGEAVRFLGTVHDVPGLLARSRLFVLSSITEGVSLTLLEAMARGLPVVATNVGGNPEVVAEGQTGLLVPPREPGRLAERILDVWASPDAGERMGRFGRGRIEDRFDVRRMVAHYEVLYQQEERLPGAVNQQLGG